YCPLFPHGLVASARALPVERRRQRSGLGIAGLDRPMVLAGCVALQHGRDVAEAQGFVARVRRDCPRPETVLQVAHYPRAGAVSFAPNGVGSKVDGLRRPLTIVSVAPFQVAVVEAAAG